MLHYHTSTAKFGVWAALSAPALIILFRYITDSISYGEVIHETGDWSIGLLFVALAVTPVGKIAARHRLVRFLRFHRRAIGVASFAYAALHTMTYLERKWGADLIVTEGIKPGLATGWLALAIFLVLAATSNNRSVARLGKSWKTLHRITYIAAALVFVHWILTAFDPLLAYITLLALGAVEVLRWIPREKSAEGG